MNSSRRRIAEILDRLGRPGRRNAATPALPACESLEGRQLLTGGMAGLGLSAMGPADFAGLQAPTSLGPIGAMGGSVATTAPGGGTNSASQADLAQLQDDLQTIRDQSLVTPAMEHAVKADIKAIQPAETTTPNKAAVAVLQAAARAANATPGGPTLGQAFQVQVAQNVVYLSQGVGAALIDKLDADLAAVTAASMITPIDEMTLANDHSAIAADSAKFPTAGSMPTATASTPTTTPVANPMATAPAPGNPGGFGGGGAIAAAGADVLLPMSAGGHVMTPMAGLGHAGGLESWSGTGETGTAPTAPTADQFTLQADQMKLQADTEAVQAKSQVTPAMQSLVDQDLAAIAGAASTSPGASALSTLQADIKAAQANAGGPTAAQDAQVRADRDAVFLSEGVNAALVAKLDADEAAVQTASNVTAADQTALAADLAAVKADQAKVTPPASTTATPTTTTTPTTPTRPWGRPDFPHGGMMGRGY